jgi:hypothetical protein
VSDLTDPQKILALPMLAIDEQFRQFSNDAGAATVREYLVAILTETWKYPPKRLWGESGWQYPLYATLIHNDVVAGCLDSDGFVDDVDTGAADRAVAELIEALDLTPVAVEPDSPGPEALARLFHETYERLAPEHGYETREASAKPWEQVPDNNRALMIAVCRHILEQHAGLARPGRDNPGVLDGDLAADVIADFMPRHFSVEAARELAASALAGLHQAGVVILRGVDSLPWAPGEPVEKPEPREIPGLSAIEHGLVGMVAKLRARLDWIEEGADFTAFGVNESPTAAQLWASLLQARPEHRQTRLEHAVAATEDAHACFVQNHVGRLEMLAARCERLEEQVRGLGGDPHA